MFRDVRSCRTNMLCFNIVLCLFLAVAGLSTDNQDLNNQQLETPTYVPSGLMKLIIEAYTDDILRELSSNSKAELSTEQLVLLRQKLKKLYQHITQHPSLKETRLWVGEERPMSESSSHQTNYLSETSNHRTQNKRHLEGIKRETHSGVRLTRRSMFSRNYVFSEEVCRTKVGWERPNMTYDINNNEVQVVQDVAIQQVFAYRCSTLAQPCRAINSLYESECAERHGWVYLYHRKVEPANSAPEWGYVAVPHHCACKITPRRIV